ncbi:hypothetical protein CDL15_Pgr007338 [Punica granatum]|uniref:GDP-L-galactose phosphorylase 1 n=1 Tax=Punica granatum TaxID=22663 RepID=A0A218X9A7_PUNGR|nr:hypothetical protein CDL15_Pgr007338 [Punica granatum]
MMLRIKRVPTIVSNFQAEDAGARSGCGRNCLKSCCIQGAKLPLYAFKKENSVDGEKAQEKKEPPVEFLDSLLLGEWEDRMQRGLFRYDVTACETKVIPGDYGFVAQLNEGRHLKKRPTEFRVDKVLQPFDGNKFNFTKVGQEEVLFQFEASEDGDVQFFPNAPIDVDNSPSVVAINVSPIEYGHVLLIPRIFECLPQRIDRESFLLALYMAAEAANPYFRLGYNSLGAFATINHLHFQAYYLAVPFPIEKASTKKVTTLDSGVKISELVNYPVRGLVFEGGNTLQDLSNNVSEACSCLQDNNIPYNVLIADCGRRIFLLPQCYAEKQALGEVSAELLDTQVNPAVWEISGHIVLKRREDFEGASEGNAWRLLAEVSLSEERFQEVNALIFEAISSNSRLLEEEAADLAKNREESGPIKGSSRRPTMVSGTQECLVLHNLVVLSSLSQPCNSVQLLSRIRNAVSLIKRDPDRHEVNLSCRGTANGFVQSSSSSLFCNNALNCSIDFARVIRCGDCEAIVSSRSLHNGPDTIEELLDRHVVKKEKSLDDEEEELQAWQQLTSTRREALSLYRDILRATWFFMWPDFRGMLWRDVLTLERECSERVRGRPIREGPRDHD